MTEEEKTRWRAQERRRKQFRDLAKKKQSVLKAFE